MTGGFATIDWRGVPQRIETAWVGDAQAATRPVVFLHEGLGSVAMWKDFPERFCTEHGLRGFVFSRPGYGRSTPRPHDQHWAPDFMHRQANEVLPALFAEVGIERPWLFGHSDGGSIALLHAARHAVAGVVAIAPHLFVEDISVASIEQARDAYETTDLRARLARYHDDPDSAFRGWNDVWLSPAFRGWNIERDTRDDHRTGARRAGRGRRVRHARTDPRDRASIAENPLARDSRMRTLPASRPARNTDA